MKGATTGSASLVSARDRDRLISCLSLATAAGTAGEAVAAVAGAARILRARSITWSDVILPLIAHAPSEPGWEEPSEPHWHAVVRGCLARGEWLTDWEGIFVKAC
jgi:hypothetical protein